MTVHLREFSQLLEPLEGNGLEHRAFEDGLYVVSDLVWAVVVSCELPACKVLRLVEVVLVQVILWNR